MLVSFAFRLTNYQQWECRRGYCCYCCSRNCYRLWVMLASGQVEAACVKCGRHITCGDLLLEKYSRSPLCEDWDVKGPVLVLRRCCRRGVLFEQEYSCCWGRRWRYWCWPCRWWSCVYSGESLLAVSKICIVIVDFRRLLDSKLQGMVMVREYRGLW